MIDRRIVRIARKLSRLRKRLFPEIKSFAELEREISSEQSYLEYGLGKPIDKFNKNDIKTFPYMYARWKTMKRLNDIYVDLVVLRMVDVKDLDRERREFFNGR